MKTLPCGHCVVCRKCFVKTIQTAITDRCLPLRCVVCRTKILKLKQQPVQSVHAKLGGRPHAGPRSGHAGGTGPHGRHPDPAGTSQRSRSTAAAAGGGQPTSKGLFSGLAASHHGRAPAAATGGSGTTRLPRPMHPLLIYPSEAGGERSRPGSGTAGVAIGWSEDSSATAPHARSSPMTVVGSGRRRTRHCAPTAAPVVHVSG